jgi:ribonuclease BN (tRNA processing enzyme)
MKVTVLGFYGGYPHNGIGTSGYLIQSGDYNLLLDCGSSVLIELEKIISPLQLDAVLLSHYHSDHIADVGVLQHYWQLASGDKKESVLPIYANNEDMDNFKKLDWFDDTKGYAYGEQTKLHLGPLDITFYRVQHPVVSYAVKIVERKSKQILVYTGDTRYFEKLTSFCHHADLLITDTNFYNKHVGVKWHMTAGESGKLAHDSQVKSLLLSHLPQWGDWNQLLKQAKQETGNKIYVELATVKFKIDLKSLK